jgi:hypothetical protein
MLLTLLGREVPEIPCKMIFAPWECSLLKLLQPLAGVYCGGAPYFTPIRQKSFDFKGIEE